MKGKNSTQSHRPPFFFASVFSFPVAFLAIPREAFLSHRCASYRRVVAWRVTPRSAQERPGEEEEAAAAGAAAAAAGAAEAGGAGRESSAFIHAGGSPDLEGGRKDLGREVEGGGEEGGGGGRRKVPPAPAAATVGAAAASALARGGGGAEGATRAPVAASPFPSPPRPPAAVLLASGRPEGSREGAEASVCLFRFKRGRRKRREGGGHGQGGQRRKGHLKIKK